MLRLSLAALAASAVGAALLYSAGAEPQIRDGVAPALAQVSNAAPELEPTPRYWQERGCNHVHRSKVAYRKTRRLMRNHRPHVREKVVRHLAVCQLTRKKSRAVWRAIKSHREWRQSYAHKWVIRFNSLPEHWKQWAYSTSSCESHMNPRAYNPSPFYGAFQFVLSTWYAAGGTGNPMDHSWHYQAWIAVHWRMRSSASQWPNCAAW